MTSAQAVQLTPAQRAQVAVRERFKNMGEVDILRVWYRGDEAFDLTENEDAIRQRWDFAKAQFLGMNTYGDTVAALMQEFGISIAQARNDIRNMRHAFGNLDEVPKALHRERAIEMSLKAYKFAEAKEDSDGMSKATKAYILAAGLDKDDAEKIDLEKLMKQRLYVEALDPLVRNFLLNFLEKSGGSVDAAGLFEQVYAAGDNEDFIDYEEIKQNGETPTMDDGTAQGE